MLNEKVTKLKNISKSNLPYIITWILYYAWVIVFTTWWTASPLTDKVYGTESRVLLHSITLLSSAIFVFIMKKEHFKKYAVVGSILVIISSILFSITLNISTISPMIHTIITVILATSLGIINAGILVPFVYVLNNTEKFYSVIISNLLISFLVLSQELGILNISNGFWFSFVLLISSLIPIYYFKLKDYSFEEKKCEEHIPKTTKLVYITLLLNCCYAIFCKGVGRAFLTLANNELEFNINILFYIGGILGCVIYYLIYRFLKKCNSMTWNITFATFAIAMFIYAIANTTGLKISFAIFDGIASTMGMINMYYILGVIGKKYWNHTYVKSSIFFIGVCGGVSGILLGRFLTEANNLSISIMILIVSIIIVTVLLIISPQLALTYYQEKWEEDSTMANIDNYNKRKFLKYDLTPREIEICALLEDNLTERQIAVTLSLTENTIKSYKRKLYKKLNVISKEELLKKLS